MGLSYFSTEHSAIFNAEELAKFDVVVFNNMTGDSLTPLQEAACATFTSHPADPQFQDARVEVLNTAHPVMAGVSKSFMANDEWYSFEAPPSKDFIALAGLDESKSGSLCLYRYGTSISDL